MSELPRVLTMHAIARYRLRADRHATDHDVHQALQTGRFRWGMPAWAHTQSRAEACVVVPSGALFVVKVGESSIVAVTFLKRWVYPKPDRRAFRDSQRDMFHRQVNREPNE